MTDEGMEKIVATYDAGIQISGEDWLNLHRNENLFVGPDWTVDTASQWVQKASISSYPDATCQKLREAIA